MGAVATDGPGKARLDALGALIRAQRVTAGLSLRELAERTKVSNAYLSQIERGLHEPSISVLGAIAAALDVSLEALLARAGLLAPEGERDEGGVPLVRDTEAAILSDPELSEPQRIALMSIYRSFVPARGRSRRD
jgi:transcriptional regulator with XRE-family HTH domain